jgi:hypothetical protein
MAGLVDHMLDTYVEWREHAGIVTDACARWCLASAKERTLRFAAYLAALDQEQAAASGHRDAVAELRARIG